MDRYYFKNRQKTKRALRVRKKLRGQPGRPRLCVSRSLKHISVQVIDDEKGSTIVAASTLEKELKGALSGKGGNKAAAEKVGELIASRAKEKGISKVAFDRGPARYHGRVKALADAARKGGLEF